MLIGLLDHRDAELVGCGDDDGFFLRRVHELHSIAALGDDALYVVVFEFGSPEFGTWSLLQTVPESTDDDRTLRVSILKGDCNLIADLRHEHEATIRACVG